MMALEQALRTALLHFVWQGILVSFLLWMALFVMRKRSANARYIASCSALIALVALPVVTACLVYIQPAAQHSSERFLATVPQTVVAVWSGSVASTPTWMASLAWWALPAWALGVILFSIRLAWGSRQVAILRRSGTPADGPVLAMAATLAERMGVARPVRLLMTSLAEGPSVVGWLRPVILMPAATLLGLTPEQLEAVLAHEFAHIRRYDYLVNILQMVVETILFYHPAVWWTSARIRHERELCCDDLAVSLCGDPLCYARALTKLERLRTLAPNMAMGSTGGSLMYRIQRLTGSATRRLAPSRLPGILAICLMLVCIGLCTNWTRVHAQELKPRQAPKVGEAPVVRVQEPVVHPRVVIDDDDDDVDVDVDVDMNVDTDMDLDVDVDMDTDMDVDMDMEIDPPDEESWPEIQSSIREAESAIEEAEAELASQVEEAQHTLDKLGNLTEGRTLKRIRIVGISDQARTELLKRLPIHEGDKLSKDSLGKLEKAVREVDSHLKCLAIPDDDTDAIILIERK